MSNATAPAPAPQPRGDDENTAAPMPAQQSDNNDEDNTNAGAAQTQLEHITDLQNELHSMTLKLKEKATSFGVEVENLAIANPERVPDYLRPLLDAKRK